jgi:hypothetical protein
MPRRVRYREIEVIGEFPLDVEARLAQGGKRTDRAEELENEQPFFQFVETI